MSEEIQPSLNNTVLKSTEETTSASLDESVKKHMIDMRNNRVEELEALNRERDLLQQEIENLRKKRETFIASQSNINNQLSSTANARLIADLLRDLSGEDDF